MTIKETYNKLVRDVRKLVAQQGQVVTPYQKGLATPDILDKLATLFGPRKAILTQVDVLTLKPGFYAASNNIVNGPTAPNEAAPFLWTIDVVEIETGKKLIRMTQMATGRSFKRIVLTSGNTTGLHYPNVWLRENSETILWQGAIPITSTSQIKLVDNLSNYNGLLLNYSYGEVYGTTRVEVTSADGSQVIPNRMSINLVNVSNAVGDASVEFLEFSLVTKDDTILSVEHGKRTVANLANGTATLNPDMSLLTINEVMGVR